MATQRWWLTFAAIGVSLSIPSLFAQSPELFRVVDVAKDDVLNMRSAPSANARVVGKIPHDASGIRRVGECKAWCRVRYNETVGWASRRYLAPVPAEPSAIVSSDPIGDCNSDDSHRKLAGCSALIKEGASAPAVLAVAHSRRSDAHLEAANLDAAVADRMKALKLEPRDAAYKLRLSHVHALRAVQRQQANDLDGALADYTEVIRLDPSNDDARVARSGLYVLKKNYDAAVADLRTIAERRGKSGVHVALARLYEQRGMMHLFNKAPDAAIRDFTDALRFDPKRETLFLNRGAAYVIRKDFDKATADYSKAAGINPENPRSYIRRGEIARMRHLHSSAIDYFSKAIERDPKNTTAHMLRGLAREETKQFDEAIADYRAVLKVDPSHRLAKISLRRLGVRAAGSKARHPKEARPAASRRRTRRDRSAPHTKWKCSVFGDPTFCN